MVAAADAKAITIDNLVASTQRLEAVPAAAAEAYALQEVALLQHVNAELMRHPRLSELVGSNPLELVYANHRHHIVFLKNVLSIGDFEVLARMLPWVYSSYHAHGFAFDYFTVELQAWVDAIDRHLPGEVAQPIVAIYRWMLEVHPQVVVLSQQPLAAQTTPDPAWEVVRQGFLARLLRGEGAGALQLAVGAAERSADIGPFYLQVIQPALYEIGQRWQVGLVSVAEEHLATSIVSRVMAAMYARFASHHVSRGQALITSAPDEFHDLGAQMVADLLELDGWDVTFLGANTPVPDLLRAVEQHRPFLLGLSLTMPFSLGRVREIVRTIRQQPDLSQTRVLVGGRVFNTSPMLWRKVGADGYGCDAAAAVRQARDWWEAAQATHAA